MIIDSVDLDQPHILEAINLDLFSKAEYTKGFEINYSKGLLR